MVLMFSKVLFAIFFLRQFLNFHFLNFKRFQVNISLLAIFRLLFSYLWYYYKASLVREEVACLWQVTFYNTVKEWFWSECRKTKTKVITGQLQITQLANPRMNQGLPNKYIYPTQSAGKHVLASNCYAWCYFWRTKYFVYTNRLAW